MKKHIQFLFAFFAFFMFGQTHAQIPDLGTASTFALFTVTGAVSNTGALTNVTGNVGTNSGAISSFTTGQIVGRTESATSTTLQASADVKKAYEDLVGLTPTKDIQTDSELGGKTLGPGIYYFGEATNVGGKLILDGKHNINSVFIFQVNGALTVTATSSVVLMNGATPNHVFWQVEGAASFAASSAFAGVIIANGAVAFGDNTALLGKGLSIAGAISVYNSQVKTTNSATPLPVQLTFLSVTANAAGNTMDWTTATEKNCRYFQVEHSDNGVEFIKLALIDGQGNATSPKNYSYTDKNTRNTPRSYYRLKQIDVDGSWTYYAVKACFNIVRTVETYPNPFQHDLNIILPVDAITTVIFIDVNGKQVFEQTYTNKNILINNINIPDGMYTLNVKNANRQYKIKVMKEN